jgi:hypothetical protein
MKNNTSLTTLSVKPDQPNKPDKENPDKLNYPGKPDNLLAFVISTF